MDEAGRGGGGGGGGGGKGGGEGQKSFIVSFAQVNTQAYRMVWCIVLPLVICIFTVGVAVCT